MTGLFAGLSISGVPYDTEYIAVTEYENLSGFIGDCSGWQRRTAADWCGEGDIEPVSTSFLAGNPLDIAFTVKTRRGSTSYDTRESLWTYSPQPLSDDYLQHFWKNGELFITAVTFTSANEKVYPFIRPCNVSSAEAYLDASCVFLQPRYVNLRYKDFGGAVVLTAGTDIFITPDDIRNLQTAVIGSPFTGSSEYLRYIGKQKPDKNNCITLVSGDSRGCYKFIQDYEDIDLTTNKVVMRRGEIFVYNSCTQCCDCKDFAADYEEVRSLHASLSTAIEQYNTSVKNLNDTVIPVFNDYAKKISNCAGNL